MQYNNGISRIGIILLLIIFLIVGGGAYYYFNKTYIVYNWKLNTDNNDILLFDKVWGGGPCPPVPDCVKSGKIKLYNSGKFLLQEGNHKYKGQISQERINDFVRKIKETGILNKSCPFMEVEDYDADYVINIDGKEKKISYPGCQEELYEIEKNLNISNSDYKMNL
jgi:hypothetical protein